MLITLLRAPDGATMEEIVSATGWLAHYADVRIMPM
jgi:alkylhydroperoxidase/carboxymuconolactone decarboxylase family protein YurZ